MGSALKIGETGTKVQPFPGQGLAGIPRVPTGLFPAGDFWPCQQ